MKNPAPRNVLPHKKKNIYIILLTLAAAIAIIITVSFIIKTVKQNISDDETPITTLIPTETTKTPYEETSVSPETEASFPETTEKPIETEPPVTEAPITEPPVTEPPVTTDILDTPAADPALFNNTLFIGDSRTVGLYDYAELGNATVFADHGINVFRLFKEDISVDKLGMIKLDRLLSENSYSKIYLMLGLNEIGYEETAIIKKYSDVLDSIKALQPDATIYLMANLHITAERSSRDPIYNNLRLNAINEQIAQMADGSRVLYLDSNELFDDENGCLKMDYAIDDFHLKGKYYKVWANWIAAKTNF